MIEEIGHQDLKGKQMKTYALCSSFEKLTGLKLKNTIGKKATEVLPYIQKDKAKWIERYGEVALEGKSIKFEDYSENL